LRMALRDSQGSPRIIRLPGSRQEAQGIQEILKPDVLVALDFNANRENILHGALEQFRFVHFATHGIIDVSHPEMSGLVLSLVNEQGRSQDGYLRLGDIYKLKLSADLVVLSACNSALGKDLESEGIIGLPRGFLYAGSKSVIASLWKVDDDAAADFMKGLYVRIKQGESPSSALRGVQLEMAQGHRWSEPFYWAAFTLQGDYK
jgi:CHAT domain-containing protein